jgi:hypothetical protein
LNAGVSTVALARKLLRSEHFAVLATCGRRGSHASLVAVLTAPEQRALVFFTPRGTLKYRNLAADPRVSLLLSRRPGRGGRRGLAMTAAGRVRELPRGAADHWMQRFLRANPGLKGVAVAGDCAVFMLRPRRLSLATGVRQVHSLSPAAIAFGRRRA